MPHNAAQEQSMGTFIQLGRERPVSTSTPPREKRACWGPRACLSKVLIFSFAYPPLTRFDPRLRAELRRGGLVSAVPLGLVCRCAGQRRHGTDCHSSEASPSLSIDQHVERSRNRRWTSG